ncbi:hypothetical protein GGI26_004945, partial [Coemansia sp. RSA 1358]
EGVLIHTLAAWRPILRITPPLTQAIESINWKTPQIGMISVTAAITSGSAE